MVNWRVWWVAVLWALIESAYFGWNFTPQSDAELICDGISFLILALSFLRPGPQHNEQQAKTPDRGEIRS